MENQFDAAMQKRTDAELIKILTGPADDYQPLALEAAKREFEKRNIPEAQVEIATKEIEYKQQLEQDRADTPLGVGPKIIAFILPGIILLMLSGLYKADGYDRKARELVRWTLYGFCFYVVLIILVMILDRI